MGSVLPMLSPKITLNAEDVCVCVCVSVTVLNPNRRGCLRQSASVPCVSMNFPSGDRSDPGSRSPTRVAGRGVRVFAALGVCVPLQVMT